MIIQTRDRGMFTELAHLGVATSEQIKVLAGFGSTRRINDRLHRLLEAGLLRRCFIGTIFGGKRAVYALSLKGAAAIGVTARPVNFARDELVTADQFIRHELEINELYLSFRYRALPEGVRFVRWRRFSAPLSESIRLIPDGYGELETANAIRSLFIEVDLGSESLRIWKQKVQAYLQLALSGDFSTLFGRQQFRVLVLANSERRLAGIRKVVASLTDKIFWFAALPNIHASGLFAAVWLRPTGDNKLTLL